MFSMYYLGCNNCEHNNESLQKLYNDFLNYRINNTFVIIDKALKILYGLLINSIIDCSNNY